MHRSLRPRSNVKTSVPRQAAAYIVGSTELFTRSTEISGEAEERQYGENTHKR
jgi:hypothetical protein